MFGLMSQLESMFLRIRSLFFISSFISFIGCGDNDLMTDYKMFKISGSAQGTSYSLQVFDTDLHFTQNEIDSLLDGFDGKLSTYVNTSLVSRFNQSSFTDTLLKKKDVFSQMLLLSDTVFHLTDGYFDPSIKPVIDLWGFGTDSEHVPSTFSLDSAMLLVGYTQGLHFDIEIIEDVIQFRKKTSGFQLDFNAIAQGYSVDLLMDFIKSRGHENVYVELGGEIKLSGAKGKGQKWKIGVETPKENNLSNEQVIHSAFSLSDCAIATSGNYRKYFISDGELYAHTINPKTGLQNRHQLLSATVVSESCAFSDALATYFMVVGLAESKRFIEQNPDLNMDVYFIYSQDGKYKSYCSDDLIGVKEDYNS